MLGDCIRNFPLVVVYLEKSLCLSLVVGIKDPHTAVYSVDNDRSCGDSSVLCGLVFPAVFNLKKYRIFIGYK